MTKYDTGLAKTWGRDGFRPADIRVLRPAGSEQGSLWTHSQMANFQKLQYWGLIEPHVTDANYRKRGWWRVTMAGYEFLSGMKPARLKAITFNKRVRRHEGAIAYVEQLTGGWKYRGDYAAESRPQDLCAEDQQMMFQ